MIFICVKWKIKPEYADQWPEQARDFTEKTRAEDGNLFFEWSRNLEDPNQYTLIEAFQDDAAEAHVTSDHFKQAQADLPKYVAETPDTCATCRSRGTTRKSWANSRSADAPRRWAPGARPGAAAARASTVAVTRNEA